MQIREMWYRYKIESIELFLLRAFKVNDEYARAFSGEYDDSNSHIDPDRAFDVMKGYHDIVVKAVYSELNALIELEYIMLAKSLSNSDQKIDRKQAWNIINKEIEVEKLPRFQEIDEIRIAINAYKHDDGFTKPSENFSGKYEEAVPGLVPLFGYKENRYPLDWEKAHRAIQATKEFLRALPGERQGGTPLDSKPKPESEEKQASRHKLFQYMRDRGAFGHVLDKPNLTDDPRGGYEATCKLCKERFWSEHEFMVEAWISTCPGKSQYNKIPEASRKD